jgi:hypothetical protein
MRVCVATPCYQHVHAETFISLVGALLRCFPHELYLTSKRGPYLDVGREFCVRDALVHKCDKLLFVDSDMVFRQDALNQIVSHDKDIIGGNYYEKHFPLESTVRFDDGKGGYQGGKISMPKEPFKCAAVATGFMAINLKRLAECMSPPYFSYGTVGTEFEGEDIGFCRRARKAGLEVWCDPTIPLLHMGEMPYGMIDDFSNFPEGLPNEGVKLNLVR